MSAHANAFDALRTSEFRGLGDTAYLNAASLGPLPERARLAIAAYGELRGRPQAMRDEDFTRPLQSARELAARLVGAQSEEIALGANTSFGINLAALGLRVPPNSVVLASGREFPANIYPWMGRERLRLETVPTTEQGWPDEDRMLERLNVGDVSILTISSVQFDNGFRADLRRFGKVCQARGIFFVIDAIQSLGQLPLDVEACGADVVATGGHKWLCGPFGTGFAYVRREVQERLDPVAIGWSSMRNSQNLDSLLDFEWSFLPDARRYEVATQPLNDFAGFGESLSLTLEAGTQAVADHVDRLLEPLRAWLDDHQEVETLSSFAPAQRSGIVSFRTPAIASTLRTLKAAGVICSLREGAVRVAAHLYNTDTDIARLIEVLDARARDGWR